MQAYKSLAASKRLKYGFKIQLNKSTIMKKINGFNSKFKSIFDVLLISDISITYVNGATSFYEYWCTGVKGDSVCSFKVYGLITYVIMHFSEQDISKGIIPKDIIVKYLKESEACKVIVKNKSITHESFCNKSVDNSIIEYTNKKYPNILAEKSMLGIKFSSK